MQANYTRCLYWYNAGMSSRFMAYHKEGKCVRHMYMDLLYPTSSVVTKQPKSRSSVAMAPPQHQLDNVRNGKNNRQSTFFPSVAKPSGDG